MNNFDLIDKMGSNIHCIDQKYYHDNDNDNDNDNG